MLKLVVFAVEDVKLASVRGRKVILHIERSAHAVSRHKEELRDV
jgi:hypothetical protein